MAICLFSVGAGESGLQFVSWHKACSCYRMQSNMSLASRASLTPYSKTSQWPLKITAPILLFVSPSCKLDLSWSDPGHASIGVSIYSTLP